MLASVCRRVRGTLVAALSQDPASKKFRIHFRFGGRQHQTSLKTTDLKEAEAAKGRIQFTLRELENGRMTLPPDADFWTFVFTTAPYRTRRTDEQDSVMPTLGDSRRCRFHESLGTSG
jgi:hypothetical protein